MHPYLRYATEKQSNIVSLIREMVECESPSDSPGEVNRFVDLVIERTRDIAEAKTIDAERFGKHLRLEFKVGGAKKEGQLLGVGHSDTVWPSGTLKSMPYREAEGRLWGPGVLDMKSGLAFFIYAVRALRELDVAPKRNVALWIVSDEEVGSKTSRAADRGGSEAERLRSGARAGVRSDGKIENRAEGRGQLQSAHRGKGDARGYQL